MHVPLNVLFVKLAVDMENSKFYQIYFNKGQTLFGERLVATMVKEYKQMEDMNVLKDIEPG